MAKELSGIIEENKKKIKENLRIEDMGSEPESLIDEYVKKIKSIEDTKDIIYDEKLWTFILAAGYAMSGPKGVSDLFCELTDCKTRETKTSLGICLEGRPQSPRKGEDRSHIDLAIGDFEKEDATKSGIKLIEHNSSFRQFVFCEMKWYSDISVKTAKDKRRNQLTRIIESALIFNKDPIRHHENICVSFVAPALFMNSEAKSRLYRYKLDEYLTNGNGINGGAVLNDIKQEYGYQPRGGKEQKKLLNENINFLKLKSLAYEDLIENMKDEPKKYITSFMKIHVDEQLREAHQIYK